MAFDANQSRPVQLDALGRAITYLRLSVTDRCDLRCTYCMAEQPDFLPKSKLLTYEQIEQIAEAFIQRGVRKIRVTGGEPLVRKDIGTLFTALGRFVQDGRLDELTLTTNATILDRHAEHLVACGVKRVNISIDSLRPDRFREITRGGDVEAVLRGIAAAKAAGLSCKLNIVALREQNADEIPDMITWAHSEGHEVTLIEVMPTADTGFDRRLQFLPLTAVREELEERWTLTPTSRSTGGPARYWKVEETGGMLGLITPLTENFCAGCNRVRVTATGRLVLCLGQEDGVDLREPLLRGEDLSAVIDQGLNFKPERHGFEEAYAERRAAVADLPGQ